MIRGPCQHKSQLRSWGQEAAVSTPNFGTSAMGSVVTTGSQDLGLPFSS